MHFSVCFVTAELAPHAKAGGLADVSAALTRLLSARGHHLRIFMPRYANLDCSGLAMEPIDQLARQRMTLGGHHFDYSIVLARRGRDLPDLLLVDCPALFGRPGIYGSAADEYLRFVLLSRAALEACRKLEFAPDIVHCHDWHTALLPLYLKALRRHEPLFERARSVLTVHNLGYQGVFGWEVASELGLGDGIRELDQAEAVAGRVNFLRQGLRDADVVNTVSPTYAREICTPAHGMGLDAVLRARPRGVAGILNGVDTDDWDPAVDEYLPWHYSAGNLGGKKQMRKLLCERLGLRQTEDRPLVGMVSRLVWQKGTDLLFDVLPAMLEQGQLSLAMLGDGEPKYKEFLTGLAGRYPGLVAFKGGYDEELAHWIEAGSDAFLMPSRYEPCGLNQMYSMRYGTVPVVHRTGGLADSVQHFDPGTGEGTGILFNDPDAGAVRWALDQLLRLYADRASWKRVVANAMARDFSWEPAVDGYLELYSRALATAR